MDTRVAVISIIVEDSDPSKPSTSSFTMPVTISSVAWVSHTVKKESASSVSPLMLHRISSVLFPARLAD